MWTAWQRGDPGNSGAGARPPVPPTPGTPVPSVLRSPAAQRPVPPLPLDDSAEPAQPRRPRSVKAGPLCRRQDQAAGFSFRRLVQGQPGSSKPAEAQPPRRAAGGRERRGGWRGRCWGRSPGRGRVGRWPSGCQEHQEDGRPHVGTQVGPRACSENWGHGLSGEGG